MFRLFNKKKKDNKGFTLVELVIVVAILAILVGILAPQYTKYVERSRQSADASNLDNLVTAVKVATADGAYDIAEAKYDIVISKTGTTIYKDSNSLADSDGLYKALEEYAGADWKSTTLKSSKWTHDNNEITLGGTPSGNNHFIGARCAVASTGAVTVTYCPSTVKNSVKEKEETQATEKNP